MLDGSTDAFIVESTHAQSDAARVIFVSERSVRIEPELAAAACTLPSKWSYTILRQSLLLLGQLIHRAFPGNERSALKLLETMHGDGLAITPQPALASVLRGAASAVAPSMLLDQLPDISSFRPRRHQLLRATEKKAVLIVDSSRPVSHAIQMMQNDRIVTAIYVIWANADERTMKERINLAMGGQSGVEPVVFKGAGSYAQDAAISQSMYGSKDSNAARDALALHHL